jgi:hypothetical protein
VRILHAPNDRAYSFVAMSSDSYVCSKAAGAIISTIPLPCSTIQVPSSAWCAGTIAPRFTYRVGELLELAAGAGEAVDDVDAPAAGADVGALLEGAALEDVESLEGEAGGALAFVAALTAAAPPAGNEEDADSIGLSGL